MYILWYVLVKNRLQSAADVGRSAYRSRDIRTIIVPILLLLSAGIVIITFTIKGSTTYYAWMFGATLLVNWLVSGLIVWRITRKSSNSHRYRRIIRSVIESGLLFSAAMGAVLVAQLVRDVRYRFSANLCTTDNELHVGNHGMFLILRDSHDSRNRSHFDHTGGCSWLSGFCTGR